MKTRTICHKTLLSLCFLVLSLSTVEAENPPCEQASETEKTTLRQQAPEVRNVVFMIGDGMGLAQVAATMIDRGDSALNLERARFIGLSKTGSANNRVTDSAAAGTALSTGVKTYNGAIGMDVDKNPRPTILEKAEANGLATGVVATYSVTHATPASFVAHVPSRKMEERIAAYYPDSGIDLFFGGGKKFFTEREDGRNLTKELETQGYTIVYSLDELLSFEGGRSDEEGEHPSVEGCRSGTDGDLSDAENNCPTARGARIGALLAHEAMPTMREGRGDYLPKATEKALNLLKNNSDKGFFVMIEGSMIDGGCHAGDPAMVFAETVDFDRAVGAAFDFADHNPGTLVVVVADHETGGLTLPSGKPDFSLSDQGVKYEFSTGGHTAILVPIYAYGAGAENFSRIMDNTDIPKTMERLLGFE